MAKVKFFRGLCLLLLVSFTSLQAKSKEKIWDYIIVGNGSAGAILARKLSDSNKKKVLVLEAGINQDNDPAVLDFDQATFFTDLTNITSSPFYAETYTVNTYNPLQSTSYSEGRGWGGSSKHNYFVAVRGTPPIFDDPVTGWAAISGNPAWSYSNMLPLMLALENYTLCMTPADPAQRGTGGPISITQLSPNTSDALSIGFGTVMNTGFIKDYNDPTSLNDMGHPFVGVSSMQAFVTSPAPCTTGVRSFSSRELLPASIVAQAGPDYYVGTGKRLLRIQNNCHVARIIFKGKKAQGVEFIYNKGKKTGKAYGKKIILCAGAVNTPAILQRSGIGDPAILGPLGISVLIPNTNVGANLQNQYGGSALAAITSTSNFGQVFTDLSTLSALPPPYFYTADFVRRVQIDILPLGLSPAPTQLDIFLLAPKSVGSVQIVSTDPLIQPLISLNLYTDAAGTSPWTVPTSDANMIVTAFKLANQAVVSAGGTMINPPPSFFATGMEQNLFTYIVSGDGLTIEDHIVGTTRMGTSSATAVVDGNLHVFGVKNLMIADIGVLPNSPNGNTCYSAYMVGLRACTILGVPVPPAR